MPNYSARDMLKNLPVRMANGGFASDELSARVQAALEKQQAERAAQPTARTAAASTAPAPTYGKYGQTAADLLAAEQRILGEIAADPSSWDPAVAYNAILESGVTIEDALNAGVKQSTIDAIFTSGAPLPVTAFSTPSTVTSAFESAPYAGQSMEQIRSGAQNYVAGLMADGLTDAERRELQTVATQQGATFQDILAAGVDPSILFNVPVPKEEKKTTAASVSSQFPQTQAPYTAPTVYQPIEPQPDIYAPGEEALDREFRDSPPRTEVTDQYGNLAGFDYTPAAKLLSATGSGYSFTPPSVTSRPRSLMDTGTLNRYTQGRAAQDLRQLSGANYDQYSGLLNRTGSYGGGLSRSQLYALMRQQDSQQPRGEQEGGTTAPTTGTISDYLRLNEDVGIDYARAKAAGELPAGTTPEAFALNHYNTYGRAEIAAGKRSPFTLAQASGSGPKYTLPAIAEFGEGDEESRQSNFTTRGYDTELLARDLGTAGGARIVPVFAEGGPVKKSKGSASTDLEALDKYANGGLIDKAIQKGAEALGFDDERQVAISQEAVDLTNQMVDAGLIGEQYRVELLMPKDASKRTRQNTGIKGDEEVFNAVNHALFAYDAGQSPLSSIGAQAKEIYQGLNKKMGGSDPRSEYLDYFNNKFGFNLAKQGLSRQEAKNAIMDTLGNINNQGTRGRLMRGEPVQAGQDLLTNVEDAKYPWE